MRYDGALIVDMLEKFETMLAAGRDSALLRFSLGSEYLKAGAAERAAEHLARAVEFDPHYSAAWKLYGKALAAAGRDEAAAEVFQRGIQAAETRGDKQAVREMQVFLRRLQKKTM